MMDERGRLTPVDVVFAAAAIAVFSFMVQPFYNVLSDASLGQGTGLLFQMLPPALVLTLAAVTYKTALTGGQ